MGTSQIFKEDYKGTLMKVRTKADLAQWIRTQLGSPVVNVILDTTQLDDCIDEACEYFSEFAGAHGNNEEYLAIIQVQRHKELMLLPTTCESLTASPHGVADITFKAEYQLPRNVIAVGQIMDGGNFTPSINGNWITSFSTDPMLQFAFDQAETFNSPTLAGIGSSSQAAGLFFPGTTWSDFSGFNGYGSRGGSRSGGGGIDLITYELGLEYQEMLRQRYTVKIMTQFLPAKRTVRITPRPHCHGMIILPVYARADDKDLYDNIWIRRYAKALVKLVIGNNTGKYDGITYPGGIKINAEKFTAEGTEEKKELEQEIADNKYGEPPQPFFFGE